MASSQDQNPSFATTRWTLVLAAGEASPTARAALARLCQTYWFPLYAYLRRRGYQPETAEDLTQGFFSRVIEHHDFATAHPARGRFRSFLLAALQHFVANQHDHDRAVKRGGRVRNLSLDFTTAEERYHREPATSATPESLFHRQWALDTIHQALVSVRLAYTQSGKEDLFDTLKPFLTSEDSETHAQAAARLQMSADAVKAAVHRLRRRYADALRAHIADTIADPRDIDAEIRDLFTALAG